MTQGPTRWFCRGLLAESPPGSLDLARPDLGIAISDTASASKPADRSAGALANLLGIEIGAPRVIAPDRSRSPIGFGAQQGSHGLLERPLIPVEHWVRGIDLTAIYEPDDARRLRITATWRRRTDLVPSEDADVATWQLVLSAQTSVLETTPSMNVVSRVPSGEVIETFGVSDSIQAVVANRRPQAVIGHGVLMRAGGDFGVLLACHPFDSAEPATPHPTTHPQPTIQVHAPTGPDGCASIMCSIFGTSLEKGVILRGRILAAIGPAVRCGTWARNMLVSFSQEPPDLST